MDEPTVTSGSPQHVSTCISPKDSHFADVNVLGMDFLAKHRLSIMTDFEQEEFELKRIE
jgi:hypothetical protein